MTRKTTNIRCASARERERRRSYRARVKQVYFILFLFYFIFLLSFIFLSDPRDRERERADGRNLFCDLLWLDYPTKDFRGPCMDFFFLYFSAASWRHPSRKPIKRTNDYERQAARQYILHKQTHKERPRDDSHFGNESEFQLSLSLCITERQARTHVHKHGHNFHHAVCLPPPFVCLRVCRPWMDVKSSYEIQIKQEKKNSRKMRNWKTVAKTTKKLDGRILSSVWHAIRAHSPIYSRRRDQTARRNAIGIIKSRESLKKNNNYTTLVCRHFTLELRWGGGIFFGDHFLSNKLSTQ